MRFDYNDLETSELLLEARKIVDVLDRRNEEEGLSLKDKEQLNMLANFFGLELQKKRYFLEIASAGEDFYVEWETPNGSTYKEYRRNDEKPGIPDEELLERAPAKWLENLLLGVYEVTEVCC